MVLFPNCKINLGLTVLDKRDDGYHNIETVFFPVDVKDAIEVISSADKKQDIVFSSSGLPVDGIEADNLCVKAYRLLKNDFPSLPQIQLHLHKTIPLGAGLGGGSADAAFTLILLNKKFQLNFSVEKLSDYALQLGSDCPFFIINKPALAHGRGEILQPIDVDLSAYKIAIINPGIHINTAWAFKQLSLLPPQKNKIPIKDIITENVNNWRQNLQNDFETVVFAEHPLVADIKSKLYQLGAVYASMSGSGSTVFGIFKKEENIAFSFPPHYFIRTV